jgi:hypothetical protein
MWFVAACMGAGLDPAPADPVVPTSAFPLRRPLAPLSSRQASKSFREGPASHILPALDKKNYENIRKTMQICQ